MPGFAATAHLCFPARYDSGASQRQDIVVRRYVTVRRCFSAPRASAFRMNGGFAV